MAHLQGTQIWTGGEGGIDLSRLSYISLLRDWLNPHHQESLIWFPLWWPFINHPPPPHHGTWNISDAWTLAVFAWGGTLGIGQSTPHIVQQQHHSNLGKYNICGTVLGNLSTSKAHPYEYKHCTQTSHTPCKNAHNICQIKHHTFLE